jgi:hypothetical protein
MQFGQSFPNCHVLFLFFTKQQLFAFIVPFDSVWHRKNGFLFSQVCCGRFRKSIYKSPYQKEKPDLIFRLLRSNTDMLLLLLILFTWINFFDVTSFSAFAASIQD